MNPVLQPEAATPGGFFASAAGFGVAAPRPGFLLVLLMCMAAAIVVSTGLDLYFLPEKVAYLVKEGRYTGHNPDSVRANELASTVFIAAVMAVVLGLIAFGHNWARWVWLVMCFPIGGLVALGTLVMVFPFSPALSLAKCVLYLLFFVTSCLLFAPPCNAWFHLLKSLRERPGRRPAGQQVAQAGAASDTQPYHPYVPPATQPLAAVALPPAPATIKLGMLLCICSALAGSLLSMAYLQETLAAQGIGAQSGWIDIFMYGTMAISTLMMLVVMYFMTRGAGVARWIWLAMIILGTVNAATSVATLFQASTLFAVGYLLAHGLLLAGTVLLFLPASNRWFSAAAQARLS